MAVVFTFTFGLNLWQDAMGPEELGYVRDASLRIVEVVPSGPLATANARVGDIITGINGEPLESFIDADIAATKIALYQPFTIDIARGSERLRLTVVLSHRRAALWNWSNYVREVSLQAARATCLLLAILIASKKPDVLAARLAAWLLASFAIIAPLSVGEAALVRTLPVPLQAVAMLSLAILPILTPTAWLYFFASFPRRLLIRPWQWLVAASPALLVELPFVIVRAAKAASWTMQSLPLEAFAAVAVVATAQQFAGIGMLVVNYRRTRDLNEQRKLRVLLLGVGFGWIGGVMAIAPLQVRAGEEFLRTVLTILGPILFLSLPFSFAYTILRHRLLDVSLLVRRGIQYAFARGLVVAALPAAVAAFLVDVAIHEDDIGVVAISDFVTHTSRAWIYGLIGVLAVIAQRRRTVWLERIDRRFFRERYNAQQILRQIVEEIRHAPSLERVATLVVMRIEAAVHPTMVSLLVRAPNEATFHALASAPADVAPPYLSTDGKLVSLLRLFDKPLQISAGESRWLLEQLPADDADMVRRAGIDLLVPISLSPFAREAILVFGAKRSEEPYGREDEGLLVAIAGALALLVERPATSPVSGGGLEECPACGACYDIGVGRCTDDGATLVRSTAPRVLIGRYRLDRRLGRGGMGTVYRALDTRLERQVALKLIRDDLLASSDAADRFRREAKVAAAITHPNLVTLHDYAVDDGNRAFLVMELLSGITLRQHLHRQHVIDVPQATAILRTLCTGLAVLHDHGVIHRDVKPENVFLLSGRDLRLLKLLDFGLAKFAASTDATTHATAVTGVGLLVGTPRYMSPEQLEGRSAAPSWDLWALAVIAYEVTVGAHPFAHADSIGALHGAILEGRFTAVDRPAWQAFFTQALNPVIAQRPQSASDLLLAFERAVAPSDLSV